MKILSSPEEFLAWKEHPATQEYLTFLKDRQSDLKEAWGRGLSTTPEQQAQAVLLGQMVDLRWSDLADQYGWKREEADNEHERD